MYDAHNSHRSLVNLDAPFEFFLRKAPIELTHEHLFRSPSVSPLHRVQGGGVLIQRSSHLKAEKNKYRSIESCQPVEHLLSLGFRNRKRHPCCRILSVKSSSDHREHHKESVDYFLASRCVEKEGQLTCLLGREMIIHVSFPAHNTASCDMVRRGHQAGYVFLPRYFPINVRRENELVDASVNNER